MEHVSIIGFSGYSNSGKTTLIEKLIRQLKTQDMRVAIIKHHAHKGLNVDEEGRDSWRFSKAGADMSIVSSPNETAIFEKRSLEFQQLIEMVHDVDIIIVEGFKQEPIPQIGICRKETNKGFPSPFERYLALVTDLKNLDTNIEVFDFNQIEEITSFILKMHHQGVLERKR